MGPVEANCGCWCIGPWSQPNVARQRHPKVKRARWTFIARDEKCGVIPAYVLHRLHTVSRWIQQVSSAIRVRDMPAGSRKLAAMAYNERLADDIRARIGNHQALTEREMFGGLAFMIGGNMAVTVSGDELMVRVGKDAHDAAVARAGARIVERGRRQMRGWIKVSAEGMATEADFNSWVDRGVGFAESLPKK